MFSLFSEKTKVTDLSWLEVDVHTHALPGVDQSVPNVSSAKHIVEALASLGFKKLICTPISGGSEDPGRARASFLQLKGEMEHIDKNVELMLAGEYVLSESFSAEGSINAMNKRYVLISMDKTGYTASVGQKLSQHVFELVVRNYRPIIAHPERYTLLAKDRSKLKRLKDKGCLLQVNLLSLTGYYGGDVKNAALSLIKDKLYDLAGTDLQSVEELAILNRFVQDGKLYEVIGTYPFKNKSLF